MSKKDLQSLTTNLAALADQMPSQRVERREPVREEVKTETPVPVVAPVKKKKQVKQAKEEKAVERDVQYSFSLRASLRKELLALAHEHDMTVRAFILAALKSKGLNVRKEDLLDLRKRRG